MILAGAAALSAGTAPGAGGESDMEEATRGIALYALSRGQGVPQPTREVLDMVRERFNQLRKEGVVTLVVERRIGLEGETRICAVFASDAALQNEWRQLEQAALEVDLVDARRESCE